MSRHRSWRGRRTAQTGDPATEGRPSDEALDHSLAQAGSEIGSYPDWLGAPPSEDAHVARLDVPLAVMLMLGESPWQRIDGMGLARQALEAPVTGDRRRDLSGEERFMLANGRAWCLAVHADLAPQGRRDDPIVITDADRYATEALAIGPDNPQALTTRALIALRRGRSDQAVEWAGRAVRSFGGLADAEGTGRVHGPAVLAVVTLALARAGSGDRDTARTLGEAARAVRIGLDIDATAFGALMAELSDAVGGTV